MTPVNEYEDNPKEKWTNVTNRRFPETITNGPWTKEKTLSCVTSQGREIKTTGGYLSTPPEWPHFKIQLCHRLTGPWRHSPALREGVYVDTTTLGKNSAPPNIPKRSPHTWGVPKVSMHCLWWHRAGNKLNVNQSNRRMSCDSRAGEYYTAG